MNEGMRIVATRKEDVIAIASALIARSNVWYQVRGSDKTIVGIELSGTVESHDTNKLSVKLDELITYVAECVKKAEI